MQLSSASGQIKHKNISYFHRAGGGTRSAQKPKNIEMSNREAGGCVGNSFLTLGLCAF